MNYSWIFCGWIQLVETSAYQTAECMNREEEDLNLPELTLVDNSTVAAFSVSFFPIIVPQNWKVKAGV